VTCQGSVPESIIAFMDANDYETAIRNAISLGGDADTMACIAGGIAQSYYKKIPLDIVTQVHRSLPQNLWRVWKEFNEKYNCEY
jgi:ADP-ribosylglycohydrolase